MNQPFYYPGTDPSDMGLQQPDAQDFQDILAMAGPLFGSAAAIDNAITQRPGELTVGARTMKENLMELERNVKRNAPIPQPIHHAPHQYVGNPVPPVQHIPIQPQHINSPFTIVREPDPQLEFNLNSSQQEISNTLLKEISSRLCKQTDLLTKILEVLQSNKDATKIKSKQTRVPKAPLKPRETE